MVRSEWGELENRLEVLLLHMLTWGHQPARRSRSWQATMREQRTAIRRLLRRSPGLKRGLETTFAAVYPDAVGRASDETGLSAGTFPERLPYGVAEVLEPEPAAAAASATGRGDEYCVPLALKRRRAAIIDPGTG
jgi:transposase